MDIRERILLILGANFLQRQQAIKSIKKRILKEKPLSLNTLTFYSKEIDIGNLEEELFTVSFDKQKIIIFKDFCDLAPSARRFLLTNLKKIVASNYLIFETNRDYYQLQKDREFISDKFFIFILKKATLVKVNSFKKKISIEDFMISIGKNDLASSLYILENLFEGGGKDKVLGPQIIGILAKKFSYLTGATKKRYFEHLWEADRAIKEKGLSSRLVLETLLVKLFGSS